MVAAPVVISFATLIILESNWFSNQLPLGKMGRGILLIIAILA
jgi:hypothetical protein